MEQTEFYNNPVTASLNYAGVRGIWMIDPDWGMQQLRQFVALNTTLNTRGDLLDYFKDSKKDSLRLSLIDPKSQNIVTLSEVNQAGDYATTNAIAHIRLSGAMFLEDGLCHYGMNTFAQNLRMLGSLKGIKGVVLSVNSGGGEALAGQKLHSAVMEFGKPLVAHVEMAGSAAYMGILGADRIIGEGTMSSAGSIGALASINKESVKFLAENYEDIYSDLSPGKNKSFRDYMDGDISGIKEMLNRSAADFQAKVRQSRPIGYKEKETLEGGMFYGLDAKKRGLIDQIGGFSFAVSQLNKLI